MKVCYNIVMKQKSPAVKFIIVAIVCCLLAIPVVFFGITLVRFFWFRPFVVDGKSMSPTLSDGELRYYDAVAEIDFYDVCVFYRSSDPDFVPPAKFGANQFLRSMPWGTKIAPTSSETLYVKRVVGLSGDTVELRAETVDGVSRIFLYRNREKVAEDFVMIDETQLADDVRTPETERFIADFIAEYGENALHVIAPQPAVVVPDDCYYVLGDNRDHSVDSRIWGAVSRNNFIGKVRL